MNSISDVDEVWSISVLPKTLQKELAIDKIMLSEIVYELRYDSAFNGEVLGCLQVFYTFLKIGDEPFFTLLNLKISLLTLSQVDWVANSSIFIMPCVNNQKL
jgi:hypothetical protein